MTLPNTLRILGFAATLAYCTPLLTPLSAVKASGSIGFFIKDAVTVKECGACHQPYDPGLMPQGSWRRVMANLQNHFGDDASLDETTRAHIEKFLVSRALKGDGPLRITEQRWFTQEHRGGFSFSFFDKDPAPTNLSNCNSCHGGG